MEGAYLTLVRFFYGLKRRGSNRPCRSVDDGGEDGCDGRGMGDVRREVRSVGWEIISATNLFAATERTMKQNRTWSIVEKVWWADQDVVRAHISSLNPKCTLKTKPIWLWNIDDKLDRHGTTDIGDR